MGVARVEIRTREPFAEGQSFGSAGPYERVDGVFHLTANPGDPANKRIVDLARAERGPDGRVHFAADFSLLQAGQPGSATATFTSTLSIVGGRRRALQYGDNETINDGPDGPGDGFLLRRGWSILFGGWQWDVVRRPGYLGLEAPQALDDSGRPIQGTVLVQFQPSDPYRISTPRPLATQIRRRRTLGISHRPYPAADVDDPDAVLTVRELEQRRAGGDSSLALALRSRSERGGDLRRITVPLARRWLPAGPITEVTYRTRSRPVAGTGLLAVEIRCRFCATPRRGTLRRAESATRLALARHSVADFCASSSTRG